MTQSHRLPNGGRIDRSHPLTFQFNGKSYQGYRGDTLASALLANGIRTVGRSFKYHRPRGIVSIGADEPNAIMQIGEGGAALPNYKATQVELYDGLVAHSVNAWPSLEFDLLALNGHLSPLFPAGFYYKTFMWPRTFWRHYEHQIRKASGLGVTPSAPDPDQYDKRDDHCDVLIVGAGPAGLAAALEAARQGARVFLVDDQAEFGGRLLDSRAQIDGLPAMLWVSRAISTLAATPDVRLLPRSTVFGYYDHNFLGVLERVTDHLPSHATGLPRQRLWRIRAKHVVVAAGAFERPLVFHNNDRPGVMLASAVAAYINRFGVLPGKRAVLFTNNDSAYQTALDVLDSGAQLAAIVDVRASVTGALPNRVRERGVEILSGHAVADVSGAKAVHGVEILPLDSAGKAVAGSSRSIACDLLAVSGGWTPALDMYCQSGGKAQYSAEKSCFLPGPSVQAQTSAGACAGSFSLLRCLAEGFAAGAIAAQLAGAGTGQFTGKLPTVLDEKEEPLQPTWLVPSSHKIGRGPKQFVDYQNDCSVADILLAARENFQSIEHIKRYTLLGFGTDQGKLGNVNGIGILAQILNTDMASVGTTTFRPMYSPVTFGALAGRDIHSLADPVRKTPLYEWHAQAGALFENVGQWKRAWYYPRNTESLHDAVSRECLAVQNAIGILDYSTLGKIDISGLDALRFLNWIYSDNKSRLAIGRCSYGLMLGENGMLLDDGILARLGENHYFMTTTTGGAARVMSWLERWLQTEWPHFQVHLTSVTDHWANISINGPKTRQLISELCVDIDFSREAFPFMSFREGTVAGAPARVFRVSFSGELAYEINIPACYARAVWEALMAAGEKYGITPYGTETLHVLRADKGYAIVGQDSDGAQTPIDWGMGRMVAKNKEFLGKRSLLRSDTTRSDRKQFVGLLTENPKEVLIEGAQIVREPRITSIPMPMVGHVTSSYYSARVGRSIALGVVKGGHQLMDQTVYIARLDGSTIPAKITSPVFYDPEGHRQNA